MKRSQQLFEKIEEYLANTLSQEQKVAFEKEIAMDSKLSIEVDKQRDLHRVLSDTSTLEFKRKLQRIHQEIKAEEQQRASDKSLKLTSPIFSYWKIAATLIIFLGIGGLLWNNFKQSNHIAELYASHYAPYPVEDVTRGQAKNDLSTVLQHYENGEYKTVINELEGLAILSKKEQLQLYLGNSYLNTGREEEAILQFENVSDTSKYNEDATWYSALTYLKLNKIEKSRSILQEIIEYNGLYKIKALALINQLEK